MFSYFFSFNNPEEDIDFDMSHSTLTWSELISNAGPQIAITGNLKHLH